MRKKYGKEDFIIWFALLALFGFFLFMPLDAEGGTQPKIEYHDNDSFISSVKTCADYENSLVDEADQVPVEIILSLIHI